MTEKAPIVCIGLPTWEGEYAKSTVQLMSRLARDRKVLYVDYQYTLKDVFGGLLRRGAVPVMRILGLSPRLRVLRTESGTSVHVLTPPPVLPVNFLPAGRIYEALRRFNQWIVLNATRRAMVQSGIVSPIVVNAFNPFIGAGSVGALQEHSHVYYCYDEIAAATWARRHGGRLEARYLSEVDGVITTSEALEREKGGKAVRIVTVKNGVDGDLFTAAAEAGKNADKKIIGYVGSVDARFDVKLVVQTARAYPDSDLRIIGRIVDDAVRDQLDREPNIVCTGPKPMPEVATEVAAFRVGLIPFLRTEFTKHIYPLKVNEYLSAGVPVVMTDFAMLQEFSAIVHVAADAESFLAAIGKAMSEWSPEKVRSRTTFGSRNDWNVRVDEFARFVDTVVHPHLERAA